MDDFSDPVGIESHKHTTKHDKKNEAGTSGWPSWISHFTGSFFGHSPNEMLCLRAKKSNESENMTYINEGGFTSIQTFQTHTRQ